MDCGILQAPRKLTLGSGLLHQVHGNPGVYEAFTFVDCSYLPCVSTECADAAERAPGQMLPEAVVSLKVTLKPGLSNSTFELASRKEVEATNRTLVPRIEPSLSSGRIICARKIRAALVHAHAWPLTQTRGALGRRWALGPSLSHLHPTTQRARMVHL